MSLRKFCYADNIISDVDRIITVEEGQSATISYELRKDTILVDWFKNKIQIKPSTNYKIHRQACIYSLDINYVSQKDAGDYQLQTTGTFSPNVTLIVNRKSKYYFFYYC